MIRIEKVAEVMSLLRRGMSANRVARETGVSRRTVANLATGRREPVGLMVVHIDDVPALQERRCPGCGGLVMGKCLLCTIQGA